MTNDDLVLVAEAELARRALRTRFLSADYFGEGSWNILLDLFIAHVRNRTSCVKTAAIASGIPATTALRCIALLESDGLIVKSRDTRDTRRLTITLTRVGLAKMQGTLALQARHDRQHSSSGALDWAAIVAAAGIQVGLFIGLPIYGILA